MDRVWAGYRYTTELFQDPQDGCVGLSLLREYEQRDYIVRKVRDAKPIASVTFWDALGQFNVEISTEIPVEIAKEFIQEAEARIQVT